MALEKNLRKINFVLALLIIITPLMAHYAYIFPYIYLKNIIFRALIIAGSFFMLWYSLYKDKLDFKKYWLWLAFVLFLLIQLLAAVFGNNFSSSIFGNFERMEGLIHLASLGLYFLLLINTFKNTKDWLWIFRISLLASILAVAYVVLGKLGWIIDFPVPPSSGVMGNTLFLGSYLMFNVFFALWAFYIDKGSKGWRIFYLLAILIDIIFIFINASRSSMIGLVIGGLLLMVFMFSKVNKKIKILFVGLLIAGLAFVGTVIVQKDSAWVQNVYFLQRLTNISRADFSTVDRLLIWQVAVKAFADKPILGYGPENAIYGLNKHFNPEISEQWFDRVHNFVLDHLLNAGILGLLSFLTIFFFAFKSAWQYLKQHYFLAASLISLLVAYLISSLFSFDSLVTWLPLIVALAFIDFLASQGRETIQREIPLWLRKNKKYLVIVFLILAVVLTNFMIVRPTKANKLGIKAAMYAQVDSAVSVEKFTQAFDYDTFGNSEIIRALADMAKISIPSAEESMENKEKIMAELEREILVILDKDPHNVRMRMVLADSYLDFAKFDSSYINKATDLLAPGFTDSPNRLELRDIMARAYVDKGDLPAALASLEDALNIYDGNQRDFMNVFYMTYVLNNMEKFDDYVHQYLAKFDNISIESYNTIARYYINKKEGQKLLDTGIVQTMIELEPEMIGHNIVLLDAYNTAGLKQEALDYINKIAEVNQGWAEQLQKYWDLVQE